jgi:hypothetical protein
MTSSGIFLEYHGPFDFPVVDTLLLELKTKKEYNDLRILTKKRTYSLFVECIENICKHSAVKTTDDERLKPGVSLWKDDHKLVILAGNPISEQSREKLTRSLDHVNNLTNNDLKKMHELRISSDPVKGCNGAGLGFIYMVLKSENKLGYSFHPLSSGYLYFEIQISLNI